MPSPRHDPYSNSRFDQRDHEEAARFPIACGISQDVESVEKAARREQLYDALDSVLNDRERYVLETMYFGQGASLREMAALFSISHAHVSRIRDAALKRSVVQR